MTARRLPLGSLVALIVWLLVPAVCALAAVPDCSSGGHAFELCEMHFDWSAGELPASASPYRDDLIHVEFRSPSHRTYLIHGFWDGGRSLRVRFVPTEAGAWTYHVTGEIKRYNDHEDSFSVADSALPGMVSVANLRHWWTTNKQPHLWLAAEVPWMKLDQATFEQWLDARKHDGFTHIKGTLLTGGIKADQPDLPYFRKLDDRLLAAASRGFVLDLVLADSGDYFKDPDARRMLINYLVARYGALNLTWEGLREFETVPNARQDLKDIASQIQDLDGYKHPISTDARDSSSVLLPDGWENFLIEGVPNPALGAVEHQFTTMPEIHTVRAVQPDAFRHELWNCTTNGEYPSVSYEALKDEANVKAIRTWVHVLSDTRHWELEPYFDADGARAVGLEEVEYLAYADKPGIVEITLPKHKYNPVWVNPLSGEEIELKDYKGEVLSQSTPSNDHDWVLQVPREGHKAGMLKSYRFESVDPPVQEPELDATKIPFEIADPAGESFNPAIPIPFEIKLNKKNRATRSMQYVWWGETVDSGVAQRLLAVGAEGTLTIPPELLKNGATELAVHVQAINANGKAYQFDKVYQLQR